MKQLGLRVARWSVRLLVGAALALLLCLVILSTTQPGSRWLLGQLPGWLAGLELGQINGSLVGGLSVERLRYRDAGIEVAVEDLKLRWNPFVLPELRLAEVTAASLLIRSDAAAGDTETTTTLPEFLFPLPLRIDALTLQRLELTGWSEQPVMLEQIRLEAWAARQRLALDQLQLRHQLGSIEGSGWVDFSPGMPLGIALIWRYSGTPVPLEGETLVGGSLERLLVAQQTAGALSSRVAGLIEDPLEAARLDLRIELDPTRAAALLADAEDWQLAGRLRLQGALEQLQATGDLDLTSPDQRHLPLALAALWDGRRLQIERLLSELEGTRLQGRGWVEPAPPQRWELQLEFQGLDPGLWAPELAGSLEGRIDSRGNWDQLPQIALALQEIRGTLRGLPFTAAGTATIEGQEVSLEGLRLALGDSSVQAAGGLQNGEWRLEWQLAVPQLGQLEPGWQGDLRAAGRVAGAMAQPVVEGSLDSANLQQGDLLLQGLSGRLRLALGPDQPQRLSLQAESVRMATTELGRVSAQLDGSMPRLQLGLESAGPAGVMNTAAELDLAELPKARIRLTRLRLQQPEVGNWELAEQALWAIDWPRVSLPATCLRQQQARLCVDFAQTAADHWDGGLSLQEMPLAPLQTWLGEEPRIDGAVNAGLRLLQRPDGLSGDLAVHVPGLAAQMQLEGEQLQLAAPEAELRAQLGPQGMNATLDLPIDGLGRLQGDLALPGWHPGVDPMVQKVQGRLRAAAGDIGFLEPWLVSLAELRGRLDADLQLSGSLSAPRLQGQAVVRELGFELPTMGVVYRDSELRAQGGPDGALQLDGVMRTEAGTLRLDGRLAAPLTALSGNLHLVGEQIPLLATPEYEITANPDLRLDLNGQRTAISGRVEVPRARIRPRTLPTGSVSESPDVVISGEEPRAPAHQVAAQVEVVLGEDVLVEGFGLETKLRGKLLVLESPGLPSLGRGEVRLVGGTYQVYGAKLKINQGRLLFTESPLANPGIDLEAVRKTNAGEVGARVSGTVRKPELRLFSTPSMDESQILATLLSGRSTPSELASEQGGDRSLTALSLGGNLLFDQFTDRFGLESLEFRTESEGEDLGMALGAWLSPRLFLEYATRIRAEEQQFRVRYDLTGSVQIQAETGDVHGVDIFYKMER